MSGPSTGELADIVDVGVLGPVGLLVDADLVPPTSPVMRTLLGLLAVAPGRECTAEAVADRLWAGGASRSALPVTVHRLRRWLADTAGDAVQVARTGTGYRLELARGETDAQRFARLVAKAATSSDADRVELLREALDLWRGRPLTDLPDGAIDPQVVAGLEQQRRTAWVDLGRALLATGRPEPAARLLRPVAADHPLDELLHGVLIEALAGAGEQAEALNAYERLRARLADELGVDPSGQLQRVYLGILHQEVRLIDIEPARAFQLPADPAGFTGREDAVRQLDKLLAAARSANSPMVAAVVGMAGVGKTALAVRWAHQVREEFPDGQLYVNLRGHSPGARPLSVRDALGQLLRSLGLPGERIPADEDEAAAVFRARVAGRQLLIVLDNARSAAQVRPLLPGAAPCGTVITSRDQLGGLVARDGVFRLRLDVLERPEAGRLLAAMLGDRAHREPAATDELAALCGRLPLALRIAAANVDSQPGVSIAAHVTRVRTGELLHALEIAGDPETTLRVAFDLSFTALSGPAQRLFRLLGLVPGTDISADAVAALADEPVQRPLAELVAAHLIEPQGAERFAFHDLLSHYARALPPPDEAVVARHRLVTWYADTATGAEPAWLDMERGNIVAAVTACAGDRAAWRLASAVTDHLHHRAHTVDAHRIATAVAEAVFAPDSAATDRERAEAHLALARADQGLANYDAAVRHGEAAAELAERIGWPAGESSALSVVGVIQGQRGQVREALKTGTRALTISNTHGLTRLAAFQMNDLGIGALWQGHLAEAEFCFSRAQAIHRENGDRGGENISTISLAQLCLEAGRLDEAIAQLAAASELVRGEGEILGWPRIFNTLAAVHCEAGRFEEAVDACRTALPVAERSADRVVQASLLNNLGDALLGLGRDAECREAHQEAMALATAAGLKRHQGGAQLGLARYHRQRGELDQARMFAEQALRLENAARRLWREGQALTELAAIEQAAGHTEQAHAHATDAVRIHQRCGHRLAEARAQRILG
ncbi:MAG TPA: BTAD domain-containing putative transcriptional regulator [Pseudonocardiaceae bacterium]|nr:BTAD domain-containing putative transcriptional regulator [Pseudonocardiaceae bacterium]